MSSTGHCSNFCAIRISMPATSSIPKERPRIPSIKNSLAARWADRVFRTKDFSCLPTKYNTLTPTPVHVLSLSYTLVKSPRLLIEFRGGWNRFFETFFPQDQNFNPSTIGLDNGVTNPRDFGVPQFRFPGCFRQFLPEGTP